MIGIEYHIIANAFSIHKGCLAVKDVDNGKLLILEVAICLGNEDLNGVGLVSNILGYTISGEEDVVSCKNLVGLVADLVLGINSSVNAALDEVVSGNAAG